MKKFEEFLPRSDGSNSSNEDRSYPVFTEPKSEYFFTIFNVPALLGICYGLK